MKLFRFLRHQLARARISREIDEELRFHREMRAAEYRTAGAAAADARHKANHRFGDIADVRAECLGAYHIRDTTTKRTVAMESVWQDLRYAGRSLRRQPGFTLIAVATLALGVGANTFVFSAVNSTLLNPLPYDGADRLTFIWHANPGGTMRITPNAQSVAAWRERARSFEAFATYTSREITIPGGEDGETVRAAAVSPAFAATLGIRPILGRFFVPGDTIPGQNHVVLLTEGYWKTRFGGARNVLGQTLDVSDEPYTIVGVLPAKADYFFGSDRYPVWLPAAAGSPLAKLKPGVTREVAEAEIAQIFGQLDRGEEAFDWPPKLYEKQENLASDLRTGLWVLFGAVGFVLLVACVNVANMVLARGLARGHELAIRTAIGAERGRVVRQLLVESLLMTSVAAVLGTTVAYFGLGVVSNHLPVGLEQLRHARIDGTVLLGTVAVTVLTGVGFGLVPAGQLGSASLSSILSYGQNAGTGSRSRTRVRQALIAIEFAMSMVLFIGAALMVNSLLRLQRRDPGFDPTNLVSFEIRLPSDRYADDTTQDQFFENLLARLRQLPAAQEVAYGSVASWTGFMEGEYVTETNPDPVAGTQGVSLNLVSAGYFRTVGMPLLQGREFLDEDLGRGLRSDASQPDGRGNVAIINEAFARAYWPDRPAAGKRFRDVDSETWTTVVGVVRDVNIRGIRTGAAEMQIYYTEDLFRMPMRNVVVRTVGMPDDVVPQIRGQVASLDPALQLRNLGLVTDTLSDAIARPRFNAVLLTVLAVFALSLAVVGVYSVIVLTVQQRLHELGVRMALGAAQSDVIRLMVKAGFQPIALGAVIGLGLATGLTRFMATLLFEITPTDPTTYGVVLTLLGVVGITASYLPARRAAGVDPVIALRGE